MLSRQDRSDILVELEKAERPDIDPRHVAAWLAVERVDLCACSRSQWKAFIRVAIESADWAGEDASERLAQSFGL